MTHVKNYPSFTPVLTIRRIAQLFAILLLARCSSVEVFPLEKLTHSSHSGAIEVYRTRQSVPVAFQEYALLRSDASDPKAAADQLIDRAKELGARAIILDPFAHNSSDNTGPNTTTAANADGPYWATAIRLPTPASPPNQRSVASSPEPTKAKK